MSKFEKGQPRPEGAGRKAGTPNKKNLLKVAEFFVERGLHPVEEIMKLAGPDSGLKPEERLRIWWELLSFCESKNPEATSSEIGSGTQNLLDQLSKLPEAVLIKTARQ